MSSPEPLSTWIIDIGESLLGGPLHRSEHLVHLQNLGANPFLETRGAPGPLKEHSRAKCPVPPTGEASAISFGLRCSLGGSLVGLGGSLVGRVSTSLQSRGNLIIVRPPGSSYVS